MFLFAFPAFAAEKSEAEQALLKKQEIEWKKFYAGGAGQNAAMPQTSLAVDYYNQAVEAFQAHDHELAREALQESLKLNARNPFARELLGDIAEVEHNLPEAKAQYQKAYLIQPSDKLREKMEKLSREIGLDAGFTDFQEGRFLLKSKQANSESMKKLTLDLEKTYQKLAKDFSFTPKPPLVVILYDHDEFQEYTRLPHWVHGLYDGKIRLPAYQWGVVEYDLPVLAMHEMTHAFVAGISKTRAPSWIQEGLAVFMENQVHRRDGTVLRLAVKTQSLLPLDELMGEARPGRQNDPLYASLFYEESCSLVDYLIGRYGMFKVRKMLEAFGSGQNYDEVIRSVLEIDPEQLEKKWKNFVTKKFPSPPVTPAAATA